MSPPTSSHSEIVPRIVQANYGDPEHGTAIVALLDEYASDPIGGGEPLPSATKAALVPALQRSPAAFTLLALVDDVAVGLLNGFETLSTFAARPIFNVHDVVVAGTWRRRGIARYLLEEVERLAEQRGCCKLTLEVLEGNRAAQRLYHEMGFTAYSLRPEFGCAQFWQKAL